MYKSNLDTNLLSSVPVTYKEQTISVSYMQITLLQYEIGMQWCCQFIGNDSIVNIGQIHKMTAYVFLYMTGTGHSAQARNVYAMFPVCTLYFAMIYLYVFKLYLNDVSYQSLPFLPIHTSQWSLFLYFGRFGIGIPLCQTQKSMIHLHFWLMIIYF